VPQGLSDLDKRIVAALQLDGRSPWSEVARLAGTTESTAARRAQRLFDDATVQVVAVADPMVCGLGQPVLVQLGCVPGTGRRVSEALSARSDIRFVALSTGSWDVVAEIIVPAPDRLAHALVDELGVLPEVTRSSSALVTRNFKMSHDWSRALLGEREPPRGPVARPASVAVRLDETDRKIVAALAGDGRRQHRDLARDLTLGETGVRRRVDRLVENRALVFSTLVAPAVLGFDVELIAWLKVDLRRLGEVARLLAERAEVRYVSATAGSADLVCEAVLPDYADIFAFTTGVLGELPGVRSVDVGVELENHKRAYRPFGA
jgi:DNA-binding Lrp family transcriptional regulator